MKRFAILAALACTMLLANPAHAAIDGKVAGLNESTFNALTAIRKRNPGALNEPDMRQLAAEITADETIDPAERDLLEELTQSQFRSITATPPGVTLPSERKVVLFPTAGNAKRVLQNVLNPPLDLEAAWNDGQAGWNAIIAEYGKSAEQEARVNNFVQGKLAVQWEASNLGNGFKPLRDEIGIRYGYSNSAGSNTNTGRMILYRSMNQLDRNAGDTVPDYLYNWVRPGGYL